MLGVMARSLNPVETMGYASLPEGGVELARALRNDIPIFRAMERVDGRALGRHMNDRRGESPKGGKRAGGRIRTPSWTVVCAVPGIS